MEWRNFFMTIGFGIFLSTILYLAGQKDMAVLLMIGYIIYSVVSAIKEASYGKKVYSRFDMISDENLVEILMCYFTKRHPKLKKSVEKTVVKEICAGDYTISSAKISAMPKTPPQEADDGYTYYLTTDNGNQYNVRNIVYDRANIGDILWTVKLPSRTIQVIQSGEDYFNMFTYGLID